VKEKRKRLFDLDWAATMEEIRDVPGKGFRDIIKTDLEEGRK